MLENSIEIIQYFSFFSDVTFFLILIDIHYQESKIFFPEVIDTALKNLTHINGTDRKKLLNITEPISAKPC